MKTATIEKNVPLPAPHTNNASYPFHAMEIGDSFVSMDDGKKVRQAASMFAKRHPGYRFTTRKINGGIRIWRIA